MGRNSTQRQKQKREEKRKAKAAKKAEKRKTKGKGMIKYVNGTRNFNTCITDKKNLSNQGIIIIDHPTMQTVYDKSGPRASAGNEFQVHYWGLTMRHTADDGSKLDICIPTVYFNYKQEVTSAHIDFMLSDVCEMSAKVEPIHNMKVNELLAADIKGKMEEKLGVSLEYVSTDFNSIHRHPGSSRSQSFSSTDLSKSRSDLGVVFPLEVAGDDRSNFAGIMAIDSTTCNIAHYEYRIANGNIDEAGGMEYQEGRCAAMVANTPDLPQPSFIENLFGFGRATSNYHKYKNCSENPLFLATLEVYEELNYAPFADAIDPEVVTSRAYSTVGGSLYGGGYYGDDDYSNQKNVVKVPTAKTYTAAVTYNKLVKAMARKTEVELNQFSVEQLKKLYKAQKEKYAPNGYDRWIYTKKGGVDAILAVYKDVDKLVEENKDTIARYLETVAEKTPCTEERYNTVVKEIKDLQAVKDPGTYQQLIRLTTDKLEGIEKEFCEFLGEEQQQIVGGYKDAILSRRIIAYYEDVQDKIADLQEVMFCYALHADAAEKGYNFKEKYGKKEEPKNEKELVEETAQPGNAAKTTTTTTVNYYDQYSSYYRNYSDKELEGMKLNELELRRKVVHEFFTGSVSGDEVKGKTRDELIRSIKFYQDAINEEIDGVIEELGFKNIDEKKRYCEVELGIPEKNTKVARERTLEVWISVFRPR